MKISPHPVPIGTQNFFSGRYPGPISTQNFLSGRYPVPVGTQNFQNFDGDRGTARADPWSCLELTISIAGNVELDQKDNVNDWVPLRSEKEVLVISAAAEQIPMKSDLLLTSY